MSYVKANTDWLANCCYGIGVHWTAQTAPRRGKSLQFQDSVESFNLPIFIEAILESGADYLLFTAAHALQMIPAPHPVLDEILGGRTCERDLIDEIAINLSEHGIHLILYYNHSCNQRDDPEWEQAVGYHAPSKDHLSNNLLDIVGWMSRKYKDKIKAWWFDSPYSLDSRGPHNSVSTDMTGFQFPWGKFTEVAKSEFPDRLVTYNAGINQTYRYTIHQDYWAGELVNLDHPPKSRFLDNGLQWHGWTCLDDQAWVHSKIDTDVPAPLYTDKQVIEFVRTCNEHQCPMCFNVGIYQDGTISPDSVKQLKKLKTEVKNGQRD